MAPASVRAVDRRISADVEKMAHADISITMRMYAQFLKAQKQDTMSDLERLI
jgi:hypothetical protein